MWSVGPQFYRIHSAPTTSTGLACRSRVVLTICRATLQQPRTKASLKDPACIGASAAISVPVQDHGSSLSLENYMQLPVEQYYELDPALIVPLHGNKFALMVPRIHLLGVWLEPRVTVEVMQTPARDSVIITASECRLRGSDLVERLRLDEKFCISFTTRLTWTPAPPAQAAAQPSSPAAARDGGGTASTSSAGGTAGRSNGSSENGGLFGVLSRIPRPFGGSADGAALLAAAPQAQIHGQAKLEVWSEVLPPFNLMPRSALTAAGDAVMGQLMRRLLPLFMNKLKDDYLRWAGDGLYRQRRALTRKTLPL